MSELSALLAKALSEGKIVALPLALVGGLVTGLNPCCLAFYPAATATCCAVGSANFKQDLSKAAAFIVGTAMATSVLGVIAALAGRIAGNPGSLARYAIALVPLMMGFHLLGWVRLPLPKFAPSSGYRLRLASAFGCGFLISLVIAPCGTPVLASVLSYAAYRKTVLYGATLLFLYGFGAGVPLLLTATASSRLARKLERGGYQLWIDRGTGVLLLGLGLYLLWIA